jgi:hypothetical protein
VGYVGNMDRAVRFLLGAALLVAVFVPQLNGLIESWGHWKYAVAAMGIVLLATATFRFCPAYRLFGIDT